MTEIDDLKIKVELLDGMTLRDYFAGQAMATLIKYGEKNGYPYKITANHSYLYADAMLEARK